MYILLVWNPKFWCTLTVSGIISSVTLVSKTELSCQLQPQLHLCVGKMSTFPCEESIFQPFLEQQLEAVEGKFRHKENKTCEG